MRVHGIIHVGYYNSWVSESPLVRMRLKLGGSESRIRPYYFGIRVLEKCRVKGGAKGGKEEGPTY